MLQLRPTAASPSPASPLVLSDRLLSLAQEAHRAGLLGTANQLVQLALAVFDEKTALPAS